MHIIVSLSTFLTLKEFEKWHGLLVKHNAFLLVLSNHRVGNQCTIHASQDLFGGVGNCKHIYY